jgi:hypothetical protein
VSFGNASIGRVGIVYVGHTEAVTEVVGRHPTIPPEKRHAPYRCLPFILAQLENDKVELTDDVLNVSENGTFTQLTHFRITQAGEVTTDSLPDAGTYALNGTAVTFTFESDGSTGTGSLSGNSLTVAAGGLALIYKKQ